MVTLIIKDISHYYKKVILYLYFLVFNPMPIVCSTELFPKELPRSIDYFLFFLTMVDNKNKRS